MALLHHFGYIHQFYTMMARLSLELILELVGQMADLVREAVGEDGEAVMISIHSPRQIVVTKSGLDIVEAIRGRLHPLVDILLDILASHVSQYGDGVKRILLMLHHFLRNLDNKKNGLRGEAKWRCDLIAQVGRFKRHILPKAFSTSRRALAICPASPLERKMSAWHDLEAVCILRRLVTAFMSSRFPTASASFLSWLLFDQFVKQTALDDVHISKSWKTILTDMAGKFAKKSIILLNEPVINSRLLPEGFYLGQGLAKSQQNKEKQGDTTANTRFIIWAEDTTEESEDRNLVLTENTSFSVLSWRYDRCKRLLRKMAEELKVNLVIRTRGLPDYARGLCDAFGLSLIEYASKDEVEDLALEANIMIWSGNAEESGCSLDESFVGLAASMVEDQIGPHFYTRLVLKNESSSKLGHLLICGMTQSSALQYSKALLQCLRLLAASVVNSAATDLHRDDEGKKSAKIGTSEMDNISRSAVIYGRRINHIEDVVNVRPEPFPDPEAAEVITITRLLAARSTKTGNVPESFEADFLEAMRTNLSVGAGKDAIEVSLALRSTFESLIGSLPKHQESKAEPITIPYPLEAAVAQINTMLDMAVTALKIDQICNVKRINSI